jgi:tetratricopeptide (TPR) repeat protein
MNPQRFITVLVVALLGLPIANVSAQRAPASTPTAPSSQSASARLKKARALSRRCDQHYNGADFQKALVCYKAVQKLYHHPIVLFNLAQCYRNLKNPNKALFFYRLYLADWARLKPGSVPPQKRTVLNHMANLKVAIKLQQGQMQQQKLLAQQRALLKQKEALLKKQAEEAKRRAKERQTLALSKEQGALLRLEGLETVLARVWVDGKARAMTPINKPLKVKPGAVRIVVEARGYRSWKRNVVLQKGREAIINVELKKLRGRHKAWLITSIASLALAAGSEALAMVYTTKAKDHYEGTPPFQDDKKIAVAGHIAAGALGAVAITSLVLYLVSGERESRIPLSPKITQKLHTNLAPRPGGAFASATFRF